MSEWPSIPGFLIVLDHSGLRLLSLYPICFPLPLCYHKNRSWLPSRFASLFPPNLFHPYFHLPKYSSILLLSAFYPLLPPLSTKNTFPTLLLPKPTHSHPPPSKDTYEVSCFNTFVQANNRNKKILFEAVDRLEAHGMANFGEAFCWAFDQFEKVRAIHAIDDLFVLQLF